MEGLARSGVRPEKKRVFALYRRRPPRSAVVSFDEWGPLELRPQGGATWAKRTRPRRMRATYTRPNGVEYFLGFYDVHADCFAGHFVKRKRVVELITAFRRLRRCYPRTRLYAVLDNLPHVHDHPRFLRELRRLRIHPVFTPTDASWCNAVEAQFNHAKRNALTDTDDRTHSEHRRRIVRYIRYRNRHAAAPQHPLTRMLTSRNVKLEVH